MKTRISFLRPGKEREGAENLRTVIFPSAFRIVSADPPSYRELFLQHYGRIRTARQALELRGLVIAAIHAQGGDAEILCLAARKNDCNAAIVGRHSCCDLFLDADSTLSLRHLAIVITDRERSSGERMSIRVLDLRTQYGFVDESGRTLSSLEGDGPVFLRVGQYALLILPTAVLDGLPRKAEKAWSSLPERRYRDARLRQPKGERRGEPSPDEEESPRSSSVVAVDGPSRLDEAAPDGEEKPLGNLVLTSEESRESIEVGLHASSRGILLGRYRRCDASHLAALRSRHLSRVHLLLVRGRDRLWAVDTASTNRTLMDGRRIRAAPLEAGSRLTLPGPVEVEWQPSA